MKVIGEDQSDTISSLSYLGATYGELGDYGKEKEYYERALAIQMKVLKEEHPCIAISFSNLGFACGRLGDYEKAKEYLERALAIRLKVLGKEHPDTATSFNDLGAFYRLMGLKGVAIFYEKIGINVLQSVRGRLTSLDMELQKSFLRSKEGYYHSLVDLLAEQGRIPEAQQVLAMLKEEEFFDFIRRDEQADPRVTAASYSGMEQKQVDRFQEISGRLFRLTKEKEELLKKKESVSASDWITGGNAKRLDEIDNDLTLANEVFQSFLVAIEKEFKNESDQRKEEFASINLDAVQALQGTLEDMGHGSVLLHTLITKECLWIILTTPDVQLSVASPIPKKELFKKILAFRERLENRGDVLPMARELYDALIAPMVQHLDEAGAETLMISLDGPLRYIPIAALHDGEKWLTEKYAIVVYTEAAKDKLAKQRAATAWKAEALGVTKEHPDFVALPAVRNELESIVAGISGSIRLDEEFTKEAFSDSLAYGVPVVHVASHFRFNPGTVADSFLLLGDGQHLTLGNINTGAFAFRKVEQLTFSACNTAMGSGEGAGREVEGLGVLVQKRGAKSVMATLWSVADKSTGIFMSHFYRLLQEEGVTKADALRRTQLCFIERKANEATPEDSGGDRGRPSYGRDSRERMPPALEGYRHPYFWAPFILMGNWL
jgi:CHAT domain-containing protein